MVEEASRLIDEIKQIREQYVSEVGKRRTWPRSIKERMAKLEALGLKAGAIAKRTSVPYQTILVWRYQERKRFHQVQIAPGKSISKSSSLSAQEIKMPTQSEKTSLRLVVPGGFVVEGLDPATAAKLLFEIGRLSNVL